MHIASLDTLQRQGSDKGSPNTTSVLSGQDFNGVFFLRIRLLRPVEDFAKGRRTTSLEMGIFVEDRAVSADVA